MKTMKRYLNPPQKGDVEVEISQKFSKEFNSFNYVVNGKKESIKNLKDITTTIQNDFLGEGEYKVNIIFHGTINDKKKNGYIENIIFEVLCQISVRYLKFHKNESSDLIQIIINFLDDKFFFTTNTQI